MSEVESLSPSDRRSSSHFRPGGLPGNLDFTVANKFKINWLQILCCRVVSIGSLRTWLFFWLISLVGLLWATFLLAQGVWFWVSVWLVLAIVGTNILVLLMRFS